MTHYGQFYPRTSFISFISKMQRNKFMFKNIFVIRETSCETQRLLDSFIWDTKWNLFRGNCVTNFSFARETDLV